MPAPDFWLNKFGGSGQLVQIDETMLNYKCKAHRGRSSTNHTDSINIVEIGDEGIERCFAKVIPNKLAAHRYLSFVIMYVVVQEYILMNTDHTVH
ncbi:hypothetical protein BDAP_002228 [Binucleata daphniae]